jgi:multiple sugar transport system substrate-binding protein
MTLAGARLPRVSSSYGVEDSAGRDGPGLRARLAEAATVATVIALIVAASWPAIRILFAGDGATPAAATTPTTLTPASPIVRPPQPAVPLAPISAGPVTLTMLAPRYGPKIDHPFWDAVTADFHHANPDLTMNVELVDRSALRSEAEARLSAPDAPDLIVGLHPDDLQSATAAGNFYDADIIVDPSVRMLPCFNYREQGTGPQGYPENYGIPFTATTLELYYNKRLFSRAHIAGPPRTWPEVAADAAKIKALGETGYGLAMGAPDVDATAQLWMAGNDGGFIVPGAATWTVNRPQNVETFQWLRDNLVKPGRTEAHPGTHSTQDLAQDFAAGKLGMLIADRSLIAQTEAGALGTAFGVTQIPGRFEPITSSLGFDEDMLATTAHIHSGDALRTFVNFLLSPAYQKRFADLNRTLPVTLDGAAADHGAAPLKPFLDGMSTAEWLPYRDPAWPAVQQSVRSNLAAALTGDPQAVLDRIQAVATTPR